MSTDTITALQVLPFLEQEFLNTDRVSFHYELQNLVLLCCIYTEILMFL